MTRLRYLNIYLVPVTWVFVSLFFLFFVSLCYFSQPFFTLTGQLVPPAKSMR